MIEMTKDIERLLYTTKDGRWYWETDYAIDKLELDDEDIDFERIPEMRKLLVRPVANLRELYVPLEAGMVLTAWGDEEGLEYLEYTTNLNTENWGNGEPHRLRGYDTTYEWIAKAASWYKLAHQERSGNDNKRERIFPLISTILKKSETQKFEFSFYWTDWEDGYRDYDDGLKSYLRAMLADNNGFHHHKPGDAVKFFIKYDPEYLDTALAEAGKKLEDYSKQLSQ